MAETLLQVNSEAVIDGGAVGKLRIDAVEWNGNAEARRISSERGESNLASVTAGQQAGNRSHQPCERRIGSRGPEEIEECRGAHVLAVESRKWRGASAQLPQHAGSDHANSASRCRWGLRSRRRNYGHRTGESEACRRGVREILGQQLRVGGIDVDWPVEMQAPGVLIADADLPRAGDLPLDGQVALLGVAELEIFRYRQNERKNGQRETRGQIILIGEQGIRKERIEALLVKQVAHVGQGIQGALENGGAVEIGRRVQPAAKAG